MAQAVAILPAAGLSTRMGSTTTGQARKQLAEIEGAPIFIHTLRRFDQVQAFSSLIVPVRVDDLLAVKARVQAERLRTPVRVIEGGNARQDSVRNAIRLLENEPDERIVAIHDAVRPFVDAAIISRALEAAERYPAVIVAVPAVDTVKQVERVGSDANRVTATLQRERIVLAQTPQVFRLGLLRRACAKAESDGFYGTDEAALIEHLGENVYVVPGSTRNWKITTPADLQLAEMVLAAAAPTAAPAAKE